MNRNGSFSPQLLDSLFVCSFQGMVLMLFLLMDFPSVFGICSGFIFFVAMEPQLYRTQRWIFTMNCCCGTCVRMLRPPGISIGASGCGVGQTVQKNSHYSYLFMVYFRRWFDLENIWHWWWSVPILHHQGWNNYTYISICRLIPIGSMHIWYTFAIEPFMQAKFR